MSESGDLKCILCGENAPLTMSTPRPRKFYGQGPLCKWCHDAVRRAAPLFEGSPINQLKCPWCQAALADGVDLPNLTNEDTFVRVDCPHCGKPFDAIHTTVVEYTAIRHLKPLGDAPK